MSEKPLLTPLMRIQQNSTQSRVSVELTKMLSNEETRNLLRSRYLLGTLKQYSEDHKRSLMEFAKLRTLTREQKLGAFLIRTTKGNTIGLATVQPDLELRRYRELPLVGALPMPPRLAHRTPLVTVQSTEGSAVEAWTGPEYVAELQEAYRQLADPAGIAKDYHSGSNSWVVEPKDSPDWVKSAIEQAGYSPVKVAHFEHDSRRMETPPLSVLYQSVDTRPDLKIIT